MKKRILALVLSVAMVLGAVSFTAFADTTTTSTDIKLLTVPAQSDTYTIRTENGENFIVYDGNTFVDDSQNEKNVSKSIGAEVIGADNDFSKLADSYIVIRMKINDSSDAYDHKTSFFRVFFNTTDPSDSDHVFRVSTDKGFPTPKWLDLNDGSMNNFRTFSSSTSQGYRFMGDMDGWLAMPVKNSPTTITEDFLKTYYAGLAFYFDYSAGSDSSKPSSWKDKEILIGDALIVSDINAFQATQIEENQIVKFAPNSAEDGAYYALRAAGFHDSTYGTHGNSVGKHYGSANRALNGGSPPRTYLHTTTLPNGDRAVELKLNADYAVGGGSITMTDTYGKEWTSDTTYRNVNDGIPSEINLNNMNALAFRVATHGGAADGAFNFTLELRKTDSTTAQRDVAAGRIAAGQVTYLDANTSTSKKLTINEDGSIDHTGDLDGWIIVPFDSFTNEFFTDKADLMETWGGQPNPINDVLVPGTTMAEALGFYMNSGFDAGKALYLGDVYFLEDADKFQQYHCAHTSCTAGTPVAPTCKEGGYTPYTCDGCGKVEKRDITAAIECDELGGEIPAKAATCKEAGYTAAKKCSMCGEISKVAETIDPIAHDKNVTVEAKAATCKEAGNEAGKKCSMCGELQEGGETIAPIAHDKLGGELPAKAATCKEAGYSAAKKCSMCGEISEAAEVVAPIAHDKNVTVEAKAATCKEAGNEAGKKCSMCGELQEGGETIAPIAHDNKGGDVAGKPATCKEAGVEAAKKCSMCGEISEGGNTIAIIAHDKNVDVKEIPATCKEAGVAAGKKCSMCGEVQEGCTVIDPIAHDKTVDVAEVKATCTSEGKTAGKKCSMCGELQEGCETIAKADHDMKLKETIAPTTTDKGYDLYKCENCDETEKKNYVDELVEDEKTDEEENEENEEGETEAPDAGDNLFVIVLFMVVALGAATVIFATRKRARR